MGKRPKKKLVLFLVEGTSDMKALSNTISKYYEEIDKDYQVNFLFLQDDRQEHGDITSKFGVKPDNIEKLIYDLFVQKFLINYGLYPKDISEIIQIVDLDGAFIEPDRVIQALPECNRRVVYKDDHIEAQNVNSIRERNDRKKANLNHLISLREIKVKSKKIRYSVYYFSTNLDHFLHGDANMDGDQKGTKAEEFMEKCKVDISAFKKAFLQDAKELELSTYVDSWDFIKKGTNSLGRYSNLHLLLNRIEVEKYNNINNITPSSHIIFSSNIS